MRRSVAALATFAAALSLTAAGPTGLSGAAADTGSPLDTAVSAAGVAGVGAADSARAQAEQALRTVDRVVSNDAARTATAPDAKGPGPVTPDPSMALLRLRLTMDALSPADQERARTILARPTDHPDPTGLGYTVPAKRKCSGHICIHWVTKTADKAPSQHWVDRMLALMNRVWRYEVGTLGYRPPIGDGTRGGGGTDKFDVYLEDIGAAGYYGITVAEKRTSYNKHLWSSYIVLDNDFARDQFHTKPMDAARVTASHEFFHTIQYAYDTTEDQWLMEATATWMEEQFADDVNDNRQYLPYSQLAHPATPLDTQGGTQEYGNFVFFAYLSQHYGRGIVKSIWNRAAAFRGGGDEYSAQAIRSALAAHGGMRKVFASYASSNTHPGTYYSEGAAYPSAHAVQSVTLDRASPSLPWQVRRVRHLASVNLVARPGADLGGRRWMLRVKVDGPRLTHGPAVAVLVANKGGRMTRHVMRLSKAGEGELAVRFTSNTVKSVTITMVNASTRFTRCGHGPYSCNGVPVVAKAPFHVRLAAYQR